MAAANRRRSRPLPATNSPSPDAVATASSPYFPPELIPEVASRLTSLHDFFALRAACRAYRALLPLTPSNLASQPPLLLVPHAATGSHALFHLRLRRLHCFRLPPDDFCYTGFHSLGCRVGIYDSSDLLPCRHGLRIVHLLTGERSLVPRPHANFSRVLLSGDLALAWRDYDRTIQHCRLGEAGWRVASVTEPCQLRDLICVNGTIYVLVSPGYLLAAVDLLSETRLVLSETRLVFLGGELDAQAVQDISSLCLAECCGELLLVAGVELLYSRVFHVYRWQPGEEKWERVTSLDGCTLFLADNRFAGCLGPHHRGIRSDCIYSAYSGHWCEFSLVDGSFAEFTLDYQGETDAQHTPIWVFPSMC